MKDISDPEDDMRVYSTPVLGRPVILGSLFDARKDQIFVSDSPWSRQTVKEKKFESGSFTSDVTFFAAQTSFERMSKLNIEAHLELEFLGKLTTFKY